MHRVLARQIRRHLGVGPESLPSSWKNLLDAIDTTYQHFDEDRDLIERSLELSSQELLAQNTNITQEKQLLEQKNKQIEISILRQTELEANVASLQEELTHLKQSKG